MAPREAPPRLSAADALLGEGDEPAAGHVTETVAIRKTIMAEERKLRAAWPVLQRQTEIGFTLWLGSMVWVVANALAFVRGLPWWAALPIAALPLSVLHELEHDLIHKQYFPQSRAMQDFMLFFIWIFKSSQELSPYVRRDLHLLHHKRSGQSDDVEERLLGLGVTSNALRVLTAFLPSLGLVYIFAPGWGLEATTKWRYLRGPGWCSSERWAQHLDTLLITSPLWLGYLAFAGSELARVLLVVWAGPNVLRHACLALMSSYSHYWLAAEEGSAGDVTLQTQVLNHWALLPLQLFCFNFGAEHIIHHFVVSQPFYIRHMCRKVAWRAMEANGVRVNDFDAMWRGSKYSAGEGEGGKGRKAA